MAACVTVSLPRPPGAHVIGRQNPCRVIRRSRTGLREFLGSRAWRDYGPKYCAANRSSAERHKGIRHSQADLRSCFSCRFRGSRGVNPSAARHPPGCRPGPPRAPPSRPRPGVTSHLTALRGPGCGTPDVPVLGPRPSPVSLAEPSDVRTNNAPSTTACRAVARSWACQPGSCCGEWNECGGSSAPLLRPSIVQKRRNNGRASGVFPRRMSVFTRSQGFAPAPLVNHVAHPVPLVVPDDNARSGCIANLVGRQDALVPDQDSGLMGASPDDFLAGKVLRGPADFALERLTSRVRYPYVWLDAVTRRSTRTAGS